MAESNRKIGISFSNEAFDGLCIHSRHLGMPIWELVPYLVDCFLAASMEQTMQLRAKEKAIYHRVNDA